MYANSINGKQAFKRAKVKYLDKLEKIRDIFSENSLFVANKVKKQIPIPQASKVQPGFIVNPILEITIDPSSQLRSDDVSVFYRKFAEDQRLGLSRVCYPVAQSPPKPLAICNRCNKKIYTIKQRQVYS